MPDEIDLLRRFRDDVPGPDASAWGRAEASVAAAARRDQGTPAGYGGIAAAALSRLAGSRGRGRRVIAVVAAAAVAVAAALAAGLTQGPPPLTKPVVTAWQPARPLPGGSDGVRAPAGTWRLAGYLVSRGWQEDTAGPRPGWLTCPTAQVCYVEGDTATSPSGPSKIDSLYVSGDGARTWSVLPVPDGITFTSALSCATDVDCTAGALRYGQPVYLTTANGGHSWTIVPLPGRVGRIFQLDCTLTACRGLAAPPEAFTPLTQIVPGARFVTIVPSGQVTVSDFPSGAAIQVVNCPTASECIAAGNARASLTGSAVTLVTRDAGVTWRPAVVHGPFGPAWPARVTCVDASHCRMLGYVLTNKSVTVNYGDGSSDTEPLQYGVVAFSDDGGATWTSHTLPKTIPYPFLSDLACPTADLCYAAGEDLIPQRIGNTYNASSSVVAVTRDAGRTWQRVSFQVPARVPSGMQGDSFMTISQIQCPQPDACVALGASDQGSANTPVYTDHG
jgi:hypothetical protein